MSFNYIGFSRELIKYGCTSLLDIGANDASWARELNRYVPNIKITCIEANPACEQQIKNKGYEYRIQALSDSIKKVRFYLNKNNPICTGVSYYLENSEHYNESNFIEQITDKLDNVFPERNFDALKIDTQGSEIDILKGASKILSQAKIVVIEASLTEYNIGAPMKEDVINFFFSRGYTTIGLLGSSRDMQGTVFQEDILFIKNSLLEKK